MPATVPDPAPPAQPRRSFASWLFGYDLFISFALGPPPRGTLSYASDLARRLRERDFAVFFSEDEAPPGEPLDGTLRKALHRSRALVVVANRGTLQDPRWVRVEVEEFRRRHPGRPVIPISVGGALQDPEIAQGVRQWLGFEGRIWLDEADEALGNGIAGAALVERLALAPSRSKANVRWRWLVRLTLAVLVGLLIAVGTIAKLAMDSESRAREELRRAISLRLVAEARDMLSGQQDGGDERALLQLLAAHRLVPGPESEAGLLDAVVQRRDLRTLVPVDMPVRAIALSPDRARIVSASAPRRGREARERSFLRLWDAESGQPVSAPWRPGAPVSSLAFSADGSRIAFGADKSVRVWEAKTGAASEAASEAASGTVSGPVLQRHEHKVTTAAFSRDGTRIVSGDAEGHLVLWDANAGSPIAGPIRRHHGEVLAAAFLRDGERLVSGGDDGSVCRWQARTLEPVGECMQVGPLRSLAFSPDGSRVAAADDGSLSLWDADAVKPVNSLIEGHDATVWSLAFNDDGSRFASGSSDTIRVWSAEHGEPLRAPLRGHSDVVQGVAIGADDERIVSGGDTTLRVWHAESRESIGVALAKQQSAVAAVAFSRDGERIVSGNEDGTVRLWESKTGRPVGEPLAAHGTSVSALAFNRDGTRIASGSTDGTVRVWDANTGQLALGPVEGLDSSVNRLAFSPDDSHVVALGTASGVRLWEVSGGRPVAAWSTADEGAMSDISFGCGGSCVVTLGIDGGSREWDTAHGRLLRKQQVELDNRLATGVDAFNADRSRAASVALEGTLRVWDPKTGRPIGPALTGHSSVVTGVAYRSDGRQIVSASQDGTLRLWPGPNAWSDEICAKLTRNMSRAQWRVVISPEIDYDCQCPGLPIAPDDSALATPAPERCAGEPAKAMFP